MRLWCLPLLVVVALLGRSHQAAADEWWYYVAVDCDPTHGIATLKLGRLMNEQPTPAFHGLLTPNADATTAQRFRLSGRSGPGECHLSPSVMLRAKVGEGEALPYGQCGGDPPVWLSLWVDRRKWLSGLDVAGRCIENVLKEIRVTPAGMRVCTGPQFPADGQKEICEDHEASELARAIDEAEFPSDSDAPVQGSIVLDYAADQDFCGGMIKSGTNEYGLADWHIRFPSPRDRELKGWATDGSNYTRDHFDIDNDGKEEVVYGYHPIWRRHDADVYYASPGQAVDDAWPKSMRALDEKASPYVFPSRFRTCDGKACGANEEGEIAFLHARENDAPLKWDIRYVHAEPFLWKGVTYFELFSAIDHAIVAIVTPRPTRFDEVCIFRRILQNF